MEKKTVTVSQELTTSEELMVKIMGLEGCRLVAYLDAAGKATIGYGHTRGVKMGDKINEYWARELLRQDVERTAHQVLALGVCRTQGQLDALVSFAFNMGIGRLRKSTLLKVIRRGGSTSEIRREFKRWVYAGGRKLRGLELRREWEAARFIENRE